MRLEIIALRLAGNTVIATASAYIMVPDFLGSLTIGFLVGGAATIINLLAEAVTWHRPPTDAEFMAHGICPACRSQYRMELEGDTLVTCKSCQQKYHVDGQEVTRL